FQDGSRLVGQIELAPTLEPANLLHPRSLKATYLGTDKKTVLLQWQRADFVIVETEKEPLIIASSDNFVGNSMCLVSCPSRSCAQVTHWGVKLVSEPFNLQSWSCTAIALHHSRYQVNWQFSPFFPFFGYSLRYHPDPHPVNWPSQTVPVSLTSSSPYR
ncbi:MAG: hypothetical protein ACRC6M_09865, partial [Microcystaceae cyanobacterium]